MASNISTLLKSIVFWLKIFELVVNVVVIGLFSGGGFAGSPEKAFVAYGNPYAYIIINLLIVAALLMDEAISKRLTMALMCGGGVLFITSGALMIESWSIYKLNDLTLGSGILSIILGAIYLADTGYTFKFA